MQRAKIIMKYPPTKLKNNCSKDYKANEATAG
jgi:hypothetical protein